MILVRDPNVVERALVAFFQLAHVLELEEQVTDPTETLAVVRSDAVRRQSRNVSARGVAGVLVPNILRITLSQSRHQQIARDLGENRCAGNAEASRIAVNDCGVRNG